MSDLAARILELMRSHGLRTQTQLARRAGVPQSTIHRILSRPDYVPTLPTLYRLANALGVTVAWLTEGPARAGQPPTANRVTDAAALDYPLPRDERLIEAVAILERLDDEARGHVLAVLRLIDEPVRRRRT